MDRMSDGRQEAFLREARIAKLVTLYSDGRPSVVPVWFEWDGEEARVFTNRNSPKVERIQADPRVALSVETPVGEPEAWVSIEGDASIREGGIDVARRLAERYYPPEKAREAVAEWERDAESLVVIAIRPNRILGKG